MPKKKEGENLSIDHNNDPFWKAYTRPENQWPYEHCDGFKSVSAMLAPFQMFP